MPRPTPPGACRHAPGAPNINWPTKRERVINKGAGTRPGYKHDRKWLKEQQKTGRTGTEAFLQCTIRPPIDSRLSEWAPEGKTYNKKDPATICILLTTAKLIQVFFTASANTARIMPQGDRAIR